MSEQSGPEQSPREDESVRVREQTANDLGSPDAFGSDDDTTGTGDADDAAARYQVPED